MAKEDTGIRYIFDVEVQLQVEPGVVITPEPVVEVSLDCGICLRKRRTVVIKPEPTSMNTISACSARDRSYCTPEGHYSPSTLLDLKQGPSGWITTIETTYYPFTDKKDDRPSEPPFPTVLQTDNPNGIYPSSHSPPDQPRHPPVPWARVHLKARCTCGKTRRCGIQTNIIRPETKKCDCGQILFVDSIFGPCITRLKRFDLANDQPGSDECDGQ